MSSFLGLLNQMKRSPSRLLVPQKIRREGEVLHPDREDRCQIEKVKRELGSYAFTGQYQQEPSLREGGIVKRNWLKYYSELPASIDTWVISADLSFKDSKTNDYTVLQVWCSSGSNCYLVHQVRDRMNFPTVIQEFKNVSARYPQAMTILVEEAANGPALVQTLQSETMGIVPIKPKESKDARLANISPLFEAGNVYFPNPSIAPWVQDNVEEICSFPGAPHDDSVDASVYALTRLKDQYGSLLRIEALSKW